MKLRLIIIQFTCLLLLFSGCKKFLNEKSDKSLEIISSISDLQDLLDNSTNMNACTCILGLSSDDDYYLTYSAWQSLAYDDYRNMYIWSDDIYQTLSTNNYWSKTYIPIYTCNTVLENIDNLDSTTETSENWKNVKGSAYFYRAFYFHNLALIFSKAYDSNTYKTDMGIVLKKSTDYNEISSRATIKETYDQIISDTKAAINLLPTIPSHVMRPSKPAAYALLSRVYLSMRDYPEAEKYADSCINTFTGSLMDYNTLSTSASYPISRFNQEVIFHSTFYAASSYSYTKAFIDSSLYNNYNSNDLRKTLFFKSRGNNTYSFKGSYNGSSSLFAGLSLNEVFLTKAECEARMGDKESAINNLNTLLIKRYKTGSFTNLTATSNADALSQILSERRKELILRDTRWMDIKRLNKENYNIYLYRILNGVTYTLEPNSQHYALYIPPYVIQHSNVIQNPR